jgi:simple sugar transport system permease protein
MNLLCMGIATYLYRVVFGISKANTPFVKEAFKPIKIPLLSSIPFVGEVLFSHYLLVYIALLIVPVIGFLIYKTTFGLSVIACGENPKAADTRGIDVNRVRYITTVIGGCLAGISGSFLAIATINEFTPGAISGRGWISIVLVIFGKWTPKGILWGALFFGFVEACTLQFQVLPMLNRVPYQFIMMLPYLLTIIILFYIRKMKYGQAPTYLGVPYKRN